LFGAGKGFLFKGNPKYSYLYLLKNKSPHQIYWITADKGIYNKLNKRNFPVLKLFSITGFWKILRAKYLIIEINSADVYYIGHACGNFNFIQTWHGTPLKKILCHSKKDRKGIMKRKLAFKIIPFYLLEKMKVFSSCKYKLIISPSKEITNIFISASLNENVKITGYPRNDIFFDKSLIFENCEKKLNLNSYQKIILYCPTFRDEYKSVKPFSNDFLKKLNSYLKNNNYLFLVKKHQYEENIEILKDLSNIADVSNKVGDIQELLIFTDVLITDYSSVFFDFVLLDRPIIYYSYDYEEYLKNCRGMYYDYYKEMLGPFAKNEQELLHLIKTANNWFNADAYQEKYKKFKDKFNYYQDGKSSERLFQLLERNNKK
jgi:CDP-glycerol glycerophosphotransferase (TagB/SpsB family)